MMNLYKVLGVSEQAEAGHIKQAYRRLAKRYHPRNRASV
jgi:curved DNA-binding protein CbpA